MALLAIETATRQLGVAVIDDDQIISSFELLADYPHAVELPNAVKRVMEAAKLTLNQMDGLIIDAGPGSFTGLRIGMAFVKAMAYVSKKTVVAVSSLDVLAASLSYAQVQICPVLDAKQKNVYAALYAGAGPTVKRQSELFLGPLSEWLPAIKKPTLFVGDGCLVYREKIIEQLGEKAQFAPQDTYWPKASVLARLGQARFRNKQHEDPATLVPLYLYPLDCSVRGPGRTSAVLKKGPAPVENSKAAV